MIQRKMRDQRGLVQRDDDVIYMDEQGVGQKQPDQTKSHGTFFMDSSGVGHKEPDKSKSHGTFFMDESGVGHKEPDKSPKRSTPFFMDSSGVGHDKPDDVNTTVAKVLDIIKKGHDEGITEAAKVSTGMSQWPARLVLAEAKKAEALLAYNTGRALWNVEAADSGVNAATQAELAEAAAAEAKKHHEDTEAESKNVQVAAAKIIAFGSNFAKNRKQFGKDKGGWLGLNSPLTTAAVMTISQMFDNQGKISQAAIDLSNTVDTELAKFKKASDDAAEAATKAWNGISSSGGNTFTVVGILQQKLNATRPDGVERTPITALYDSKTKGMVRAYQGTKGITPSDRADVATWTAIDADAPSIVVNGQLTVKSKEEASGSTPFDGTVHPWLESGSKGNAVKELQQRLNNWLGTQPAVPKPPFKPLKVDGSFGWKVKAAVKAFQRSVNIQDNGKVGKLTWGELDKVPGGITSGAQQFYSEEVVEGATAGGTSAFDWDIKDGKITITVHIKFSGYSGHAMVNTWLDDIRSVWNNYKAVEQGVGVPREFDIQFNPVKSSKGIHKVKVRKPTKKDPNPRSDTDNWYVNDTRRGLAPHEFGHLVGFDDEYNRPEEAYVKTTGLEPSVGQTRATDGTSSTVVADEINSILTGNPTKTKDERLGLVADKLDTHGIATGAFARLVAQRFASRHGLNGAADISQFFYRYNDKDWTENLTRVTEPFTISNGGLMGEMTSNLARGQDLTTLAPHEHPVQPRHVQSFANLMALAFPGTNWKAARR